MQRTDSAEPLADTPPAAYAAVGGHLLLGGCGVESHSTLYDQADIASGTSMTNCSNTMDTADVPLIRPCHGRDNPAVVLG